MEQEDLIKLVIVGVVILVALLLLNPIISVPSGTRGVLLEWNYPTGATLDGGVHLITPIIQGVVLMDTKVQAYTVDAQSASRDLQDVGTRITLNYRIDPNKASEIYNNYGIDYQNTIIAPAVQEAVKASTANYTAEELITKRALVKQNIENKLQLRLAPYSLLIEPSGVSITDFQFSPQFSQAIEEKVTANQSLQTQKNRLEITKVQANQTIAIARGDANARIVLAEANASVTLIKANATARAIQLVQGQLSSSPSYLKYLAITEWNGKMPTVLSAGGQGGVPLFNINVTGTD